MTIADLRCLFVILRYLPSEERPWQTRTHCCGHIVADKSVSPFAPARSTCCGHKFRVRDTKNVSDLVQEHFCVRNHIHFVSRAFARPRNMSNNVSSFARALRSVPRLPSRGEFFEEMASMFGDEKPVYTHFYRWLVSISLHVYLLR